MTDTIADALIRIKNGYLASKNEVNLAYSKFVKSICEVLKNAGYIADYKEVKKGNSSKLMEVLVTLRYDSPTGVSSKRRPALSEVKRVSKPGLRVYKGKKALPYVLNGLGLAIVSTPKGVMSDKQARKEGLGGEIIAYVW